MVTLCDVAKKANVSNTLVSRVVNNKPGVSPKTREKIISIMNELNYRPNALARSLVLQKTETIGIVMDDLRSPYFFDLIKAFEKAGEDSGYNVLFCSGNSKKSIKRKYIKFFTEGRVDGLIIYGSYGDDEDLIKELSISNFPFVLIENEIKGLNINNVLVDNFKGAYEATCHLIKKGYKDIRHFTGDMNYNVSLSRFSGFIKAMQDYNLPLTSSSTVNCDFNKETGFDLMTSLILTNNIPEAIFFGSDQPAYGGIKALHNAGLSTPQDVAIIGFDDDSPEDNEMVYPGLSTCSQPLYEIGIQSFKLLLSVINNPQKEPEKIIFDSTLILRDTCK